MTDQLTLIIGRDQPECWICWILELPEISAAKIYSVPEGCEWAYKMGHPVSRWMYSDSNVSLSTDAIRYSAYQCSKS